MKIVIDGSAYVGYNYEHNEALRSGGWRGGRHGLRIEQLASETGASESFVEMTARLLTVLLTSK